MVHNNLKKKKDWKVKSIIWRYVSIIIIFFIFHPVAGGEMFNVSYFYSFFLLAYSSTHVINRYV